MNYQVILAPLLLIISLNCSAEKLVIAFGTTLAPWVMADTNSGILVDLISEAMEPLGYSIEPYYFPYARRIKSYQAGLVDVVFDINENNIRNSNLTGYFSGIIYAYENYAYSLSKRNYHFDAISDLTTYSVMSWQGAREQLGKEYDLMASANTGYVETHDQKQQVKMLFLERIDVIQLDQNIFKYYRKNLSNSGEIHGKQPVDSFALFGKNPNGFLFRSQKVRDAFVAQITQMHKDGRFEKIFKRYTE